MLPIERVRAMSFRELISRVREVALEGYAYQEVPFEKVLEELDLEHDPRIHR
jgi:hypothetical protein